MNLHETRTTRTLNLTAGLCAAGLLAGGCALGGGPDRDLVAGRDDIVLTVHKTTVRNGLSREIQIEVPPQAGSLLLEVEGKDGYFYASRFVSPSRVQLVEGGRFVTRMAREVPGLVDWLYPNNPDIELEGGTYTLEIMSRSGSDSGPLTAFEELEVRAYATEPKQTCGIHLDFLVDSTAVDSAQFEAAVDDLVIRVDRMYRQVGIAVIDYQIQQVNLSSPDIDIRGRSALAVAEDVLAQAHHQGSARDGGVHILLVRRIGGDASQFDPAGYSMGLPGPFDGMRPNSLVLVSTEHYADFDGVLDVDGLSTTLAHEIGHFLGLYHTSEPVQQDFEIVAFEHDPVADTPQCDRAGTCSSEFLRNVMTSGRWLGSTASASSRSILTPGQGMVMRRHPLCVPHPVAPAQPPDPPACDLACEPPETCAVVAGLQACRRACDPSVPSDCPEPLECVADDRGTWVCLPR